MPPAVTVCADAADLAARAADLLLRAADDAVRERGRASVALSGGSTPEKMYAHLARSGRAARPGLRYYFSDERVVAPDDPRSNYGLARRALFEPAGVAGNVYPIPTDRHTPADCADAYAHELARTFDLPLDGPPPRFDLVFLGLGDDGHTASLFPGAPSLKETRAWVVASPPGTLPPPVERVTFTFPVFNAARCVVFLVSGEGKAEVLRDVLEGDPAPEARPAAGVRPADGELVWLVDAAAARLLTRGG